MAINQGPVVGKSVSLLMQVSDSFSVNYQQSYIGHFLLPQTARFC